MKIFTRFSFTNVSWVARAILFTAILFSWNGNSQNLLTNPGLDVTAADCSGFDALRNQEPDGWIKTNTPDRSTEVERSWDSFYAPSSNPSPEGGCYFGFRALGGAPEGIGQNVTLVGGETYSFSFDYLIQTRQDGSTSPCTPELQVRLNGTTFLTFPPPPVEDVWTRPTATFVAPSSGTFLLEFFSGGSCARTWNFVDSLNLSLVCEVTNIVSSNESTCNDNGTAADISDDTFTADISVIFANPPATGTLDLTGDGTASVAVGSLDAPTFHTFTGVVLPANGSPISLTAAFSDDAACTLTNASVVNAPFECSDDECPDIIPPGSPTAPVVTGDVTFDITNPLGNASSKTFNSIAIAGEPNPFTDLLVPDNVSYSYTNPTATNQRMIENGVNGASITDGPAIFDPELIAANTDRNLNHYFRNDGNITDTDFVNFEFNYDINAASNRYVIITERGGNNTMEVQAIDATGNVIGTARPINRVDGADGPTTYIGTGVNNNNGQEVFATIYPLTAFVGPNVPINGVRLTQTGASTASSVGDGGDGKVFIVYDPFFLTPPPTIDLSTTTTQPTCPTNEGNITIIATSNGGGALEYSVNGLAGPWVSTNSFDLVPGTYTVAVRYQGSPSCLNLSPDTVTLTAAVCATITAENDDFSGTPIDSAAGGTTASVFADNGNGVDDADGSPASDA
ncbi:hypothetical protein, partial [uncultured Psychroserpens sp.]|uniref:hypothetical protein n=1 Tax=uncultured Psychroserpens sp. TaxID=255436 RepID=UPI002603D84A